MYICSLGRWLMPSPPGRLLTRLPALSPACLPARPIRKGTREGAGASRESEGKAIPMAVEEENVIVLR